MAGQDKRVIEQQATSEVFADDWFLKDSVTEGTTKISSENLKAFINEDIDLSAEKVSYDNTSSGLEAENVQDAIDEVLETAGKVDDVKVDGESVVDENKVANIDLSALKIVRDIPNTPTAIATFTDGANLPMPKLEVAIEPVQDLHGYDAPWVGGAGKNKFDSDTVLSAFTKNNNKYVGMPSYVVDNYVISGGFKTNTRYTLSYKAYNNTSTSSNFRFIFSYTDETEEIIGSFVDTTTEKVIVGTSAENKTISKIKRKYGNGVELTLYDIQLEEGSTATSFAPYSNICPISGWDEVNVSVVGKNFVDDATVGNYINTDGTLVVSSGYKCTDYIDIEGVTSIKTSITTNYTSFWIWRIATYDSDKNFISLILNRTLTNGVFTETVNVPNNAKYIRACAIVQNTNWTLRDVDKINTYTIDLDGTRYGGKVDLVSGVMTVTHAIRHLKDIASWDRISRGTRAFYKSRETALPNIVYPFTPASMYPISSAYSYSASGVQAEGTFRVSDALYIVDNRFENNADFVNFLTTNDVTVKYLLATPQTIQLTPTVVKSLRGVNNVSADSGDVRDGKYIADASLTIASFDARITALENQ